MVSTNDDDSQLMQELNELLRNAPPPISFEDDWVTLKQRLDELLQKDEHPCDDTTASSL